MLMRSPSRMEGNNFFSKRRLNCTTLVYTKVYHFPNNFRVYVWNAGIRNEITPSRFYLLNIGIGIKDSLWWKPKLFPGNILIHIPISAKAKTFSNFCQSQNFFQVIFWFTFTFLFLPKPKLFPGNILIHIPISAKAKTFSR